MKLAESLCFIMQLHRQKIIVIRDTCKYFYAIYLCVLFCFFIIKDCLVMVLYKNRFI